MNKHKDQKNKQVILILQEKRQKNERTISFYPYFMRKYATFGGRAIHSEMDLCALIRSVNQYRNIFFIDR